MAEKTSIPTIQPILLGNSGKNEIFPPSLDSGFDLTGNSGGNEIFPSALLTDNSISEIVNLEPITLEPPQKSEDADFTVTELTSTPKRVIVEVFRDYHIKTTDTYIVVKAEKGISLTLPKVGIQPVEITVFPQQSVQPHKVYASDGDKFNDTQNTFILLAYKKVTFVGIKGKHGTSWLAA